MVALCSVSSIGVPRSVRMDLERLCPGRVLVGESLATISRWGIGGVADTIVRPANTDELAVLRAYLYERSLPHVVIGATSNLLFSDSGLNVVCIQIGSALSRVEIVGGTISAGAGVWVPGLARRAMQGGLTGLEHTCGIPGTLGGLICMNGGSQRRGVGDVVVSVTSVDSEGNVRRRSREACAFAYRRSVFQTNDEVIAEAELGLPYAADRAAVRREMLEILSSRRRKFPSKLPNCGSVFVSDPAVHATYGPPGAIIERLGFKGKRSGGALVSPQHANFIVNDGGARSADVLALIGEIRQKVFASTGHRLNAEVRLVTPSGQILPADAEAGLESSDVPGRQAGR